MKTRFALCAAIAVLAVGGALAAAPRQAGPSSQALALYKSLKNQDWRALYFLAEFSPAVKKQLPGPDKFATEVKEGIDNSGGAADVDMIFKNMSDIQVGEAVVKGGRATVPTSSKITLKGKIIIFKGAARMINAAGIWKWDLTFTNDPEKATSTAMQELIGKPVPSAPAHGR